ncbi:MAG: ferritin-like domain-containing protein [Deltaproteobacteria bacterium]|nr:ferritin-like domain-containing protein [Deltaproteobacteria bacterium]
MSQPTDFFTAVASLGKIEQLDVDTMRLLYRIERSGEDFYNMIADRIGDEESAVLLRQNGREERGHAERVRKAIGIKLGHAYEPTAQDLENFPVPLPDAIPPEVLPVIVQGEIDGDAGYQKWADRESNPEVQALLRQNGREETRHGERVREVIALLSKRNPA